MFISCIIENYSNFLFNYTFPFQRFQMISIEVQKSKEKNVGVRAPIRCFKYRNVIPRSCGDVPATCLLNVQCVLDFLMTYVVTTVSQPMCFKQTYVTDFFFFYQKQFNVINLIVHIFFHFFCLL